MHCPFTDGAFCLILKLFIMLSISLLTTLGEVQRYATLIRSLELDVHLRDELSPSEYRRLMRQYVKEFNFLVEKLYEQDTLFLIQNL